MARSEQAATPAALASAYDVDVFLQHAKWLSEYHRARGRDVQSRGVSLLGFTGVLVALLPVLLVPLRTLHGDPRHIAKGLLVVVSVTLLGSAVCALQTLRARNGPSTRIEDVQGLWSDALAGKPEHDTATAFTEWLLHGKDARTSPVQGESDEATTRAKWLSRSAASLAVTLLTDVVLIQIVLTRDK